MFDINGRFRAPTQNLLYLDRERPPRRRCVTMPSHSTFHGAIPYGYMVEGREFLPLPRSARLHACNQLPRSARLCCCSTTPKSPPALPSDADRLTVKCACAPALAGCMLVPHLRPALGRHLPQSLHDVRLIGAQCHNVVLCQVLLEVLPSAGSASAQGCLRQRLSCDIAHVGVVAIQGETPQEVNQTRQTERPKD